MATTNRAMTIDERDEAEADRFLFTKEVSFLGLAQLTREADVFHGCGEPDRAAMKLFGGLLADGARIAVQVEGWDAVHDALGSAAAAARTHRRAGAGRLGAARHNHNGGRRAGAIAFTTAISLVSLRQLPRRAAGASRRRIAAPRCLR